ncbi:hypothetical protein [Hoeflea prorocentri]|uniref:Uncharacterized protein n=1 Tax=Hoeflea prorocentri TaxID=1922333 RepID=A0A9X3UIS6_9HYPH|nr:hypothetical protein [Hoeflea prorocentri]MCY6381580.1 hypothetical protein [Hoeflea prorocentri]MDA5399380.1 hypothetical protein [Hoeflea prorocentri]
MSGTDNQMTDKADTTASDGNPFPFRPYLVSHACGGLTVFLLALLLDNILLAFGFSLSAWKGAVYTACVGFILSVLLAPLIWRIGLVTGPHYILGGLALFVPATLVSSLVISQFESIMILLPGGDTIGSASQKWAITAYVRIARAAILFPCYLFAFWLVYHRLFGLSAWRPASSR